MNIIQFPIAKRVKPQHWEDVNPKDFVFTAEDAMGRRCSLCRKAIRPGERYVGTRTIRVPDKSPEDWYVTNRVSLRLHLRCADKVHELGVAAWD